jgi:hypothetical protein
MHRAGAAAIALFVALAVPASLAAKGITTRITIAGDHLAKPIEITDPNILRNFNVWSGPGVTVGGVAETEGFIADWSAGAISELPAALQHYTLSFYVSRAGVEELVYSVDYDCSTSDAAEGYVLLPGRTDHRYALNTRSIYRGPDVEGRTFRATRAWQQVVRPLLPERRSPYC